LLHLALLLAQQELGIDITMAPSWSSLGAHLRAFYERSAEVFLESLARRGTEDRQPGEFSDE
jgi:hypothetical protein